MGTGRPGGSWKRGKSDVQWKLEAQRRCSHFQRRPYRPGEGTCSPSITSASPEAGRQGVLARWLAHCGAEPEEQRVTLRPCSPTLTSTRIHTACH